jgi:subfamily B ATP-binding cassette protein MsbA
MTSSVKDQVNIYSRLFVYLRPYFGVFILASVCMLVVSATAGGSAFLMKPLLDDIFISKDGRLLAYMPPALILLYFVRGSGRYFASLLMQKIGAMVVRDVRNDLYRHMQQLSLSFFQKNTTGQLVSRITNDIQLVQESISTVVYDVFREGFTVITLLGVLIYRDPALSVFALLILPAAAFLIGKMGRRIRGITHNSQEQMGDLTSMMSEAFSGVRVVKAFGMENYEIGRFREKNEGYFKTWLKTIKINEMSSPVLEFLGAFGVAAIIYYGGNQVINGKTTVGSFFSFLTALFMIFNPVTKLGRVYNKIQQALASATRIFEVLDLKPEVAEREGAKILETVKREVEFKNVSFRYDTDPVLRGINLNVKAGTILAIVGMSGAGKTTMVDLIPRFYDPKDGGILFDGVDIREVTLASLRSQIGIVTQDVFLFNDTVFNNIAYGRNEIPAELVEVAAKAAYAHDFIKGFPDGYNTIIGERGARLSGGQKQRLSIARALLKNPAVLILDEATSALDTESEIEVQKALNNLMENRTTFVIAHRLSTILHANRIVVLEKGKIVEEGTHRELLERGGVYKKVFELQFAANSRQG